MTALASRLTQLGTLTAHPAAFVIVVIYAVLWMIFERETLDWHGWITLVIWLMTLFIQRSVYRDTLALHAKLDELLRVDRNARTDLRDLDDEEPEVIERHREAQRGGAPSRKDP